MSEFFQDPPRLTNTYRENRWLKAYLQHKLPSKYFTGIDGDLQALGDKCAHEYLQLARKAEREKPQHIAFDAWGRRIDEIRVSSAWTDLQDIAAREALIAIAYRREQGEFSRLYQFAKLYLFHPSSAFFTCPLAMADGAARVLEVHGTQHVHRQAFQHLTSAQPQEFWTSGQWMTEKTGGSDVSGTATEVRFEGEKARLYGVKWFSSATTSQMALALARCPGAPAGSRGLTLFQVPTYTRPGEMNHIRVLRLKDKLGTWALPTAELSLEGAYATQVGELHHGVKTVATMLNITRLYNSVCAIGQATRALNSLHDYSSRRTVSGSPLSDQVLHYTTFADEELKTLAGFLITFELAHLLGKEECKTATQSELEILRLMTPVAKLFTARAAIQTASEVVEGFGGAGYVEDTGIPVHLRDSQVFPIWEGATNVLSLDMLRVMSKSNAASTLLEDLSARLKKIKHPATTEGDTAIHDLTRNLQSWSQLSPVVQAASSRSLAFYLGRLYAFVLLLSWAEKESPTNQRILDSWIVQFAQKFLGTWHPLSQDECERGGKIWRERLEV